MQITLEEIVTDWLNETFPKHSFTAEFSPYINDNDVVVLGKVLKMDNHAICRITDVEIKPWMNHLAFEPFYATDPEFFLKLKDWIERDVLIVLRDI